MAMAVYPNDAGFETTPETREPVQLQVEGSIPDYVRGSLFRTGPGRFNVVSDTGKDYDISHWFDGLSMNHRFDIKDNSVTYRSRYACDAVIEKIKKTGNIGSAFTFAEPRDPCESIFRKVSTLFRTNEEKDPSAHNVGVTISHSSNGKLLTRTDSNVLQTLDADTLEPEKLSTYTSDAPGLKGQLSAAHGAEDHKSGEYFNYTLDLRTSRYTVFRTHASKTTVLAVIKDAPASYIHSMALTPSYLILTVWQAYITSGLNVLWNRNILESIEKEWDPSKKTLFYAIPRDGSAFKVFESPQAFFCFHTINAYEQQDDIVLDLCMWDDHHGLTEMYVKCLKSTSPNALLADQRRHARVMRFCLPAAASTGKPIRGQTYACAQVDDRLNVLKSANLELPIINPAYSTRRHRYVYGIHNQVSSLADSIIRIDLETCETKIWSDYPKSYSSPGEPIFVADPDSRDEDGGVVLTVVLDGKHRRSDLVVLCAKTLKVLARAHLTISVPFGFHGTFAITQP